MKRKGQNFIYKDELIKDLEETYKRVKREHLNRYGRLNRLLLLQSVANSPAKRFYTSEEQATRIIHGMLAGKTYPKMKPLTREMYLEIYSRVTKRLKRNPYLSITNLIIKILDEKAPKFYMTPRSIEGKLQAYYHGNH